MAKVFLLSPLLFGLLLFVADGSRNTQNIVLVTDKESDVTYIVEGPREGLQDTYCCLRNGFGCIQECDSNITYHCCLKNAFGCLQLCEPNVKYFCCLKNGFGSCLQLCDSSKEHYCCKKNGFGSCTGMCPKKVNLMK
ncbi:hypothetical protein SELMODRAFT_404277 [Selaginella moellendorffii]|uniref:Uncharacterized protein n=1 Tax=Selaginella moellendorffii TaxID=88036 RepID=D8QUU3_SELML|nr:hypothetical protein SELMODRAFT_404277 [Selaginella moellendorffii]